MAKQTYKVPESIKRSYLDHEINMSTKSMTLQPVALKVVAFWAGTIMAMVWLIMNTPLKDAGLMLVPFVAWWLIASVIMGKNSKTKEMAFQAVGPAMSYAQKGNRTITTRSDSDPSAFFSVAPFRNIDEDGLIEFADGAVGQAYLVVGSASRLVFEEDKDAILDRVDRFWRKADTGSEYIWITTKEPQRVHRQIAALSRLAKNERTGHPELRALMEERFTVLDEWVGKKFSSIHQYLILRSDNVESLQQANTVLLGEIENSSLMIRQLTRLDRGDVQDLLGSIYRPKAA